MGATQDISQFIVQWPTHKVPQDIMHYGRRCLINYFGVALYASTDSSVDILLSFVHEEGGNPRATILGRGGRNHLSNVHPSSPIFPAPLAAGELVGSSGREVLAAGIIGIEVALRLSMVIAAAYREGAQAFHITSTCGILGAAAAAGRVLELNIEQMTHALGIAATQAAGLGEVFGSMCKPFHAGRAAQGGLVAALLARRGFTSSSEILEASPRGYLDAYSKGYDLNVLFNRLGEEWELPRVGLKPYACGAKNHALIDALLVLRQQPGVTPEKVKQITGWVRSPRGDLEEQRQPRSRLETKFSYHHAMAVALVDGAAVSGQFTDAKAADPVLAAVRDRIQIDADPSLKGRNAVVKLELEDGRTYTERVDHPTGTPGKPMMDEQVSAKFRALADEVLPPQQSEDLLSALWKVDQLSDIHELLELATAPEAG